MSEYSVEEVREWIAIADAQAKLYAPMKGAHEPWEKLSKMLTAYAALLKQIERAREGVTDEATQIACNGYNQAMRDAGYNDETDDGLSYASPMAMRAAIKSVAHLLPSERGGVEGGTATSMEGKCPDCLGYGQNCLAGCSAHPRNWYECETCGGSGKAVAHPPAQAAPSAPGHSTLSTTLNGVHVGVHGPRESIEALDAFICAANQSPWAAQAAQVDAWRTGMFERWRAAAQEKGYAGIAEAINATPTAEPVAQGEAVGEVTKLVQRIKGFSGIHLKEGTGATDALYDLAVKHGASEAVAAGFAHSANGEMNELQSCVYTIAQLALNLAAQPRAVPDDLMRDALRYRFLRNYSDMYVHRANQCALLRDSLDGALDQAMLAAAPSQGEMEHPPTDCSGDPSSCPDNEGRGCYCHDVIASWEPSQGDPS